MKKIWLINIFVVLVSTFLNAQVRPEFGQEGSDPYGGGISQEEQLDAEKDIKDVESKINSWKLRSDGLFLEEYILDTLQENFHIFHPAYQNSITNTYTGNYGGAYLNNNFFERETGIDFFFLRNHGAYLLTPRSINYYNTTTPYSLLEYSQSEKRNDKNETRFNVLHTQNINQYWNATFRYVQGTSEGQYSEQDSKNHFVTLYSSYIKNEWIFHGGFISNGINNIENGGMVDDDHLLQKKDSEKINVNLTGTVNKLRKNVFFANAEYRLGNYINTGEEEEGIEAFKPKIGILYSFEMSNNVKQFSEEEVNLGYFANTYVDTTVVFDSIRYSRITNILKIKQYETAGHKYSFGKQAYLGGDLIKTVNPFVVTNNKINHHANLYVGGGIFKETGKFWKWNFEGRFYVTGYRSGQTQLSGVITKPIKFFGDSLASLKITGRIETLVPDYFQQKFSSSHFKWLNQFNNEQKMVAGIKFMAPKHSFETGFNYALLNNYIYYNEFGIPDQTKKEILVLAAYLNKSFHFKRFTLNTKLLVQKASLEDYIHLPDFSAHIGGNYKFVISKVMYTQIGFDTRFNTQYYADAFNPATGLFYLQNEKELGNYPYIDVYASLKLKRTRVFFKWMNIGTEFINKEYFTTLHYPMNRRTFRLGIAWAFYD